MIPLPAEVAARSTITYDAVQAAGETVYWIEGRPGGDVLTAWNPSHGVRDVLPEGAHVASYVHEYGGGAYLATATTIWYCDADDQRIHRFDGSGTPVPITPEPPARHALRYGDLRLVPGTGTLVCVRERHEASEVINELIALPADGSAEPRVIASGHDFYMSPEPSPDGRRLAWISWDAPLMPWDGSRLWLADIDGSSAVPVAGGEDESICQPRWSAGGVLHFASDRSGWWNLYVLRDGAVEPVITGGFDLAAAPWELGYRTYGFRSSEVVAIAQHGPEHRLLVRRRDDGLEQVALPYTSIKPYLALIRDRVAIIASSPEQLPTVVLADLQGNVRELAGPAVRLDMVSRPERFAFPTRDGQEAFGLYYPPLAACGNPPASALDDGPPPLLVRAHPGPTANWPLRLDLHAQFFTSRGFAVVDVDYRGSTGYGRAYRQRLHGQWGHLDATDCADAALHLAGRGLADPSRMAIWGASAGGYTVLQALATTDVFTCGIARSAVVNPATWRNAAPKFQAHHPGLLTGPGPSPERIARPLFLLHGETDPVTPIAQARSSAQNPEAQLVAFSGQGHVLRDPGHLHDAFLAELAHFHRYCR